MSTVTADGFDVLDLQNTLYTSANPMRRWLHRSRYDWIARAIEAAPTGGAAMEIGPGSGVYLRLLAPRFSSVLAVDIEDRFLESARALAVAHPNLSTAKANATEPGALPEAAFDLVLCTEVLEHLNPGETPAALAAIRRSLKPGGVAIVTTPQRWSTLETTARIALSPPVINLTRQVYKEPVNELGHINLMTAGHMRRALIEAGFEITRRKLLGLYLPLIGEVGGAPAVALARIMEKVLARTPLSFLLWTQCYVVRPV